MPALATQTSQVAPWKDPRSAITIAMADPEQWALKLTYLDRHDQRTQRYVSPIRYAAANRFLALCLCREEPRQFQLERCEAIELVPSASLMMPMQIATL